MTMLDLRESYHVRAQTGEDVRTLLRRANLSAYMLPASKGWFPVYLEGAIVTDNYTLLKASAMFIAHFFQVRGGVWTVRLFKGNTLIGSCVGDETGAIKERTGETPDFVSTLPPLTAAETRLLDLVCGKDTRQVPGARTRHASADSISEFFGLPQQWLTYDHLNAVGRQDDPRMEGLVRVAASLPASPRTLSSVVVDTNAITLPILCFGSHNLVAGKLKKLIAELVSNPEPEVLLEEMASVKFLELGSQIVVAHDGSPEVNDTSTWRPYFVGRAMNGLLSQKRRPSRERQIIALMLQGMRRLWWVLGTLGDIQLQNRLELSGMSRNEWLEMLNGYAYWLPELSDLSPFLSRQASGQWTSRHPFWASGVVRTAVFAGADLDDLDSKYAGDIFATLLDKGVIELCGSRFQVTQEFANRCDVE